MNNSSVFYVLVDGFVSGIFINSFFRLGFSFFLFILILAVLIFAYGTFLAQNKTVIILSAIFIFSFGLGVLRYEIKDIGNENDNLYSLVGEKVVLTGVISEEPAVKDQTVQLVVSSDSVIVSGREKKSPGKILVAAGLFPEFKYGDLIQAEGKLEQPENISTTTGNSFDYAGYLAKDDIYYEISFAQVKILSSGHGTFVKSQLFAFKNAFMNKINSLIKEPESALLGGLLLGAKNSLGQDRQAEFRQAGVSHIVALSGYNITIVAVGIMAVLSFLPRIFSLSFGALGIILFTIMTGGTATAIRAAVMALLVMLARVTNRKYDITRALLLAGVFMLVQNPKILVFDISFELSFLSTVALIFVSPILEKKMTFITEKYKLRELIVATIATQIFVLPFILYKMGMISLVSLPANLLILPFVPAIMLLGFLTGFLGLISGVLATPFAFVSSALLSYVLKVIDIFAHLPFSSVSLESFPLAGLILIYGIFLVIIWRSQKVILDKK